MRADRWLWAWLSRSWSAWRTTLVIVQPDTVIAWHRQGFRLLWTWKSRRRIGRPTVPSEVRALIRSMSETNPLWGAPRIHGELLKLGLDVSQTTVAKYTMRGIKLSTQTWRTFLANHLQQIAARFLRRANRHLPAVIRARELAHERRRVVHVAVTDHTNGWPDMRDDVFSRDRRDRGIVIAVTSNMAHANTSSLALRIADAFAEQTR